MLNGVVREVDLFGVFGLSLTTSRWATGLPGWCGPRSMNRTDLWTFIEGDPRFLWTLIPRIVRLVVREVGSNVGQNLSFLKKYCGRYGPIRGFITGHSRIWDCPPLLNRNGDPPKGGSPFSLCGIGSNFARLVGGLWPQRVTIHQPNVQSRRNQCAGHHHLLRTVTSVLRQLTIGVVGRLSSRTLHSTPRERNDHGS